MPWNETTRKQYSRKTERYESDLPDAGGPCRTRFFHRRAGLVVPVRWICAT